MRVSELVCMLRGPKREVGSRLRAYSYLFDGNERLLNEIWLRPDEHWGNDVVLNQWWSDDDESTIGKIVSAIQTQEHPDPRLTAFISTFISEHMRFVIGSYDMIFGVVCTDSKHKRRVECVKAHSIIVFDEHIRKLDNISALYLAGNLNGFARSPVWIHLRPGEDDAAKKQYQSALLG